VTTFYIIHVVVGAWLAIANFVPNLLPSTTLLLNNAILGVVIALYNLYFLLRGNVDVTQRDR
jgi:hypothetical protein